MSKFKKGVQFRASGATWTITQVKGTTVYYEREDGLPASFSKKELLADKSIEWITPEKEDAARYESNKNKEKLK